VAEPTVLGAYAAVVRSRVRAQASYRGSFAMEVFGQVVLGFVDFAEIYVIFTRVRSLGGFDFGEVSLMFGLAATGFALADLAVGHVERLPAYVRTGQFDAFLLRPLSAFGQLVTSDFSLRRVGRLAQALGVLAVALTVVDVDWTPARLLLLVVTPVAGTVVFAAVFVATASVTFWLVEGQEFANAFTYGGNYLATFPNNVFATVVRRFFTFVVPAAFVAYLPTLALLGRDDPGGLPGWLSWCGPPVAFAAALAAGAGWRAGLRRYVGTGS
jgi:viologen exporter family transport system permease protein